MKASIVVIGVVGFTFGFQSPAALPPDYKGKPFEDAVYKGGVQAIPGKIECAYYDLGGEGVAYHDTDAVNHGSGELNRNPQHQRPHATAYSWSFRDKEGVDISYTKDFADFNHPNPVKPPTNQLYIGWTANGEWCNYTVDVKKAGTYNIVALYGNDANTVKFSINNQPACEGKMPTKTGSMHTWNQAPIGTITFAEPGLQLLTFHYNSGNNFAYFLFEPTNRWAVFNDQGAGAATNVKADGLAPLFNGKDLAGWEQKNGLARYEAKDGCIVGTTVPNSPNSFLCTKQTYADFELEFEVKLDKDLNSGVQIRSESKPDYMNGRVHGYQVEIAVGGSSGLIYDEARRGKFLNAAQDPEAVKNLLKDKEWSQFRVVCQGNRIQTWVNGVPVTDMKDDMTPRGFIGLQVHGVGPRTDPIEVRWRNLRLKELKP
jgi:hypothetical protein